MVAEVIAEIRAITIPSTIETDFPQSGFWKADIVVVVTPVGHIGDYNHVVARTAIFPAMESDNFFVVVEVVDVHVPAAKTTGVVEPIPAQADQIAVQIENALIFFFLRPINGVGVAKPFVLQKFLALENHGNSR